MKNFFELIKQGEAQVKPRKSAKIPVPMTWYNEWVNHLAHEIMQAATKPKLQQSRIDKVIQSGMDHEVMSNGHKVTLAELKDFHQKAVEEYNKIPEKAKKRAEFKQKYIPVKGLKGNLNEAKLIMEKNRDKINQGKICPFRLVYDVAMKCYLSDKEVDKLFDFCNDNGINY